MQSNETQALVGIMFACLCRCSTGCQVHYPILLHTYKHISLALTMTPALCRCRENSGYTRSSLQLQAFLQIVVGEEKLRSAKQLVIDRHAEP